MTGFEINSIGRTNNDVKLESVSKSEASNETAALLSFSNNPDKDIDTKPVSSNQIKDGVLYLNRKDAKGKQIRVEDMTLLIGKTFGKGNYTGKSLADFSSKFNGLKIVPDYDMQWPSHYTFVLDDQFIVRVPSQNRYGEVNNPIAVIEYRTENDRGMIVKNKITIKTGDPMKDTPPASYRSKSSGATREYRRNPDGSTTVLDY